MTGSLVQQEKREKRVCWGHFQARKGNLELQEPKETEEPQACPASPAGKGRWAMSGREGPREWQGSRGHPGNPVRSSLAKKETEVHQAHKETQASLARPDLQADTWKA